jgi:hypothetical protein
MVTVEQIEKTEIGLGFIVKAEHGGILAWCYTVGSAQMIANSLNNLWQYSDGTYCCSGCEPIAC